MEVRRAHRYQLGIAILLVAFATSSVMARDRDTGFVLTPYLWGVAIDGDNPDIDASFGDILDSANFALSLHTEYRTEKWSFVFDPTYLDLEVEGPLGGDIGVEIWLVEAWAGYLVSDGLELLGGARYQDQEVDPKNLRIKSGDDWLDWFAGLRYMTDLSDSWDLVLRGDLVLTGDSDSATNAQVFFNRRIGANMALNLGYRYLSSDFDNDNSGPSAYAWDVVMTGPVVGYTWLF
jgi:hypothetical protein